MADDGSGFSGMGPGLTYRVRLVFTSTSSPFPTDLTVTLREHVCGRAPSTGARLARPGRRCTVSLDVAPLPDERPLEEDVL